MKRRRPPIARTLLRNANAALLAAIEIHNKPAFPYRYEVCVLLVVNAWELALKAYIHRFDRRVKVFREDGKTKDFPSCVACVAGNLGKDFEAVRESLEHLYIYRNNAAHFFWDKLDVVIFSLLRANVIFYADFVKRYFALDLAETTPLVLLPIGLAKPFSPIDFITSQSALAPASPEVKAFIQGIVESAKKLQAGGIEDSILADFTINLTNEKRLKNADIIAGIRNDGSVSEAFTVVNVLSDSPSSNPNSREVRISEEDLFSKIYKVEYREVIAEAKRKIPNFKQGTTFNLLMSQFKGISEFHRVKYLNPSRPQSGKKDWYTEKIHGALAAKYSAAADQQSLPLSDA